MSVSETPLELVEALPQAGPEATLGAMSSRGEPGAHPERGSVAGVDRPSFVFLGVVSALTLIADIATKAWAEVAINRRGFEQIDLIDGHLAVILAYNRGGAWGLLHNASEMIRRPFFLCVSAAAILFIVSLYAKLVRSQRALTWGLPLVLGGALGNLSDRISRSQVIDFIDYRADWVLKANAYLREYVPNWTVTDHWPTFNVADIAICIGVGLMALDMMTTRRHRGPNPELLVPSGGPQAAPWPAPLGGDSPFVSAPGAAPSSVDAPARLGSADDQPIAIPEGATAGPLSLPEDPHQADPHQADPHQADPHQVDSHRADRNG